MEKLADLMGGAVDVESTLGQGSTFWFKTRLGIAKASSRHSIHHNQLGRPIVRVDDNNTGRDALQNLQGARLLLVEDNDLSRQVAGGMLTDAGFVVEMANAKQQDREPCLTAGMQDVVTKPIDPGDLWRPLRTWGHPPGAFDAAQPGLPEGTEGLDTALGLKRVLGKVPRYMAMLER